MSERTTRDYEAAVERIVTSALGKAPHSTTRAALLIDELVEALNQQRRGKQYSIRTRVGLTIAHRVLTQISTRLDQELLYKRPTDR